MNAPRYTVRELLALIDSLVSMPACVRDPCHCRALFGLTPTPAPAPDFRTWADDPEATLCNPGGLPQAV